MTEELSRRAMLPSQRLEADEARLAEAKIRAAAAEEDLREDLARTFGTASGKRVLALLKQRSGFGQIILSADRTSGKLDPELTLYAAMSLNDYLFLRNHLPIELIQEIEDDRRIQPSGTIVVDSSASVDRTTSKRKSHTSRRRIDKSA